MRKKLLILATNRHFFTEKSKISQKIGKFWTCSVNFFVRFWFFTENLTEFHRGLVTSQKFCELFCEKKKSHRNSVTFSQKLTKFKKNVSFDITFFQKKVTFARKSPASIFVYLGDKVKFWKKKFFFQNLKVNFIMTLNGLCFPKNIFQKKNKRFKICLILGWMHSERKSYCMYILVI